MYESDASCPLCQSASRYDFSGRDRMFDLYERHDYYRCKECKCVFKHPMPAPETIASYYPATYDIYEEDRRDTSPNQLKRGVLATKLGYTHLAEGAVQKLAGIIAGPFSKDNAPHFVPDGELLDIGCGNGRYLATMRAVGWRVQGVEFSENGVKACRKHDVPVHHGDLLSARFADGRFDVVTARHLIEHVPDPSAFIEEVARVLKPGGELLIETPSSASLGRALLSVNWFANEVPRHLILYNPENLTALMHAKGLTLQRLTLSTTPKIFLNSLDYALENKGKPSKRIRWRRMLARTYMLLARVAGRGDVIHATFTKTK